MLAEVGEKRPIMREPDAGRSLTLTLILIAHQAPPLCRFAQSKEQNENNVN